MLHIYPSVGHRIVYFYSGLSTTFKLIDENSASHFRYFITPPYRGRVAKNSLKSINFKDIFAMKKLLFTIFGIVAVCSVAAQELPKNIAGVRVGYAPSWVTSCGVASSVKHGYFIGFSDQVLLSGKLPFYFETGLNFIAKGYRIRGYDDSSTTFNYLQLPVGITYHIRTGKHVTIEPAAGIYYAIGLGGRREYNGSASKVFADGSTSRHDLGFACGLSTSVYRFHLGISYQTGILNIDKADNIYDGSGLIGYKNIKNNGIIINIGVNF